MTLNAYDTYTNKVQNLHFELYWPEDLRRHLLDTKLPNALEDTKKSPDMIHAVSANLFQLDTATLPSEAGDARK